MPGFSNCRLSPLEGARKIGLPKPANDNVMGVGIMHLQTIQNNGVKFKGYAYQKGKRSQ